MRAKEYLPSFGIEKTFLTCLSSVTLMLAQEEKNHARRNINFIKEQGKTIFPGD